MNAFFSIPFLMVVVFTKSQAPDVTVLDGVYTEVQSTRGQALYTSACALCHGDALEGVSAPPLIGGSFIERWREDRLDSIYAFIQERMPPRRGADAESIPAGEYLDMLTYILSVNGYPTGPDELTQNGVGDVMLVGKDGPQPVPDGALVLSVGCLSQVDGRWVLSTATEPARTRTSTSSTPEELSGASERSLGILTFRLADLAAVPGFAPDQHLGKRVQAKGYLVRQPNAERIGLSSIEILDSTCDP